MAASQESNSHDGCETFVSSFAEMTRSMEAQSRALARKVSLAQLLDGGSRDSDADVDKENLRNGRADAARKSRAAAAVNEHVIDDLRSLDTILTDLERRAAAMREAIDNQRCSNATIKQLTQQTRRQTSQLAAACASLPEHLPFAASTNPATSERQNRSSPPPSGPSTKSGERNASKVIASSRTVPVLELVRVSELEEVPRSTRARLTIAQVNAAVVDIQEAIKKRHAFLSKSRKKMSQKQMLRLADLQKQEVPAHGGEPFIPEADLRALPAFKKGEVTAKALIATLRSLKRLKMVRGAGMMTYVVIGK